MSNPENKEDNQKDEHIKVLLDELKNKVIEHYSKNNSDPFKSGVPFQEIVESMLSDILNQENNIPDPYHNFIKNLEIKPFHKNQFPDITVREKDAEPVCFGIEVKGSETNSLTMNGNSIKGDCKVPGSYPIYLFYGSKCEDKPLEVFCKPYEECITDVVSTHHLRYRVSVEENNLNDSFFSKIGISYQDFSNKSEQEKIDIIRRLKNKEHKSEWWVFNSEQLSDFPKGKEGEKLVAKAFFLFPKLFGNKKDKYKDVFFWLLDTKSIFCWNVRDLFSSGGKEKIELNGKEIRVSRIIYEFNKNIEYFNSLFDEDEAKEEAKNYWYKNKSRKRKIGKYKEKWLNLVREELKNDKDSLNLIKGILKTCTTNSKNGNDV